MVGAVRAVVGRGCVLVVADEAVTVEQADRYAAVVVTSSVSPQVLGDRLAWSTAPVLVSEAALFDEFGLSSRPGRELPGHPGTLTVEPGRLAAVPPGPADVLVGSGAINTAAADSLNGPAIGARTEDGSWPALFGYWPGDVAANGTTPIPAPRVGFFAGYGAVLSPRGEALLHSALDWLMSNRPRNDDFIDAIVLRGMEGSRTVSTERATRQPGEPDHPGPGSASTWFEWTAPRSGLLVVRSTGVPVVAYTGTSLTALRQVSPATTGTPGYGYPWRMRVVRGTRYRLVTAGAGRPDVSLVWQLLDPPSNDDFAHAETIAGWSGTIDRTNVDATLETGEPSPPNAQYADHSVWFRWVAPGSGLVNFEATGAGDQSATVWRGASLADLVPAGPRVVKGDVLWVEVWTETYAWTRPTPFRMTWSRVSPPPHDAFADPLVIEGPTGSVTLDGRFATLEPGEPVPVWEPWHGSVWLRWTAPEDCMMVGWAIAAGTASVYSGASLDALERLEVYAGGVEVTGGKTYRISVAGRTFGYGSSSFDWSMSCPH